ncbi:MAG: sugar transferase, partial [Actinobacteria bacterium]|nr:sugar transferase [Actinomycetota bacterium]
PAAFRDEPAAFRDEPAAFRDEPAVWDPPALDEPAPFEPAAFDPGSFVAPADDEPRAPRRTVVAARAATATVIKKVRLPEPAIERAPEPVVAKPRPVAVVGSTTLPAPVAPMPGVRPRPLYDATKRALDLLIALSVLILGSPLWLLIAILIKLESQGAALHRGIVVGKDAKPFRYYKFRSMRIDGDDKAHRRFIERYVRENGGHEHDGEIVYKLLGDDRITAVGRWIRKFSLDEIPQLWNVVRGEMSIVGPRPPLDYEFEHYDEQAKMRLVVKPGITGMQQVWHRHSASFDEKLRMDMDYISRRSLWLDVKLIAHTLLAIPRGH